MCLFPCLFAGDDLKMRFKMSNFKIAAQPSLILLLWPSLFSPTFFFPTLVFLSPSSHTRAQSVCDTAFQTSPRRALRLPPLVRLKYPDLSRGDRTTCCFFSFLLFTACLQGESPRTSIQLDFGDGIKITYSNLSRTDDGIQHIYRATGIYRVAALAENSQGSDSSVLFLHITSTWMDERRRCSFLRQTVWHEALAACRPHRAELHCRLPLPRSRQ